MNRPLPALMDERMIATETGLPQATCRRLMRRCELIHVEGVRKVFVKREELLDKLRTVPGPERRA